MKGKVIRAPEYQLTLTQEELEHIVALSWLKEGGDPFPTGFWAGGDPRVFDLIGATLNFNEEELAMLKDNHTERFENEN